MNDPATDGLDFARCLEALTGYAPMRWQERLFGKLARGQTPSTVDLPTGLGKTSVIPIWLIALAAQNHAQLNAAANGGHGGLPRRLAYIVNRRTVVDQATDVVERMRERLRNPGDEEWKKHQATLDELANRLRALSANGGEDVPFGVSTLRGELADNQEWKADPARPAIIIGTIDMIGSKLLFSGYGDGRYGRAHHAGLIGQDALIVHDEAHLTPAFSELLRALEKEQDREAKRPGPAQVTRPIRVMELSATTRANGDTCGSGASDVFGMVAEDNADSVVQQRISAKKRLSVIEADGNRSEVSSTAETADSGDDNPSKKKGKKTGLADAIATEALKHDATKCRVLVYMRSPETAAEVRQAITKGIVEKGKQAGSQLSEDDARNRVGLLTGTIRGFERDQLAKGSLFEAFRSDPNRLVQIEHTLYLVSTSAGEVGVDLDADQLVCDLTTLDSMAQRFGRVNRLGGEDRSAHVVVVIEKASEKGEGKSKDKKTSPLDTALAKTAEILRGIVRNSGDVSPAALRKVVDNLSNEDRQAAFSPMGTIPPLTDILLDNWSLTSIDDMPGRPVVAAYLHGLTADPPVTYVVWRKEVPRFKGLEPSRDGLPEEAFKKAQREFEEMLSDWFRACRIEARERLRDRTDRVKKGLDALLKAHRKKDSERDFPVVLLNERGTAKWARLSEVSADDSMLRYRTVVLPAEAGGLDKHGMLDGKATQLISNIDVAEVVAEVGPRERWLQSRTADGESQWRRLLSDEQAEPPSALRERERIPLREPSEGAEDEGESAYLVLLKSPGESALENPEAAPVQQTLREHTEAIAQRIEALADRLGLEANIKEALVVAARWHDRGKDRPVWQHYARNDNGATPLAKSTRYLHGRALSGYRHEFGSLLEAMADKNLRTDSERDLVLHLIAAHHGRGRPHFESKAFDNQGPLSSDGTPRRPPTTTENEAAAVEVMQRFGRLQQRFGRWGLAWLESLLRCADIAASKQAVASAPAPVGSDSPVTEEAGA